MKKLITLVKSEDLSDQNIDTQIKILFSVNHLFNEDEKTETKEEKQSSAEDIDKAFREAVYATSERSQNKEKYLGADIAIQAYKIALARNFPDTTKTLTAIINRLLKDVEASGMIDELKILLLEIINHHELLTNHIKHCEDLSLLKFIAENQPSKEACTQLLTHDKVMENKEIFLYMLALSSQILDKREQLDIISRTDFNDVLHSILYSLQKEYISAMNYLLTKLFTGNKVDTIKNYLVANKRYFRSITPPTYLGLDFMMNTLKTQENRQFFIYSKDIIPYSSVYTPRHLKLESLLCILAYLENKKTRIQFLQEFVQKINSVDPELSNYLTNHSTQLLRLTEVIWQQMCCKQQYYFDMMPMSSAVTDSAKMLRSFSLTSKSLLPQLPRDLNLHIASFLGGNITSFFVDIGTITDQLQYIPKKEASPTVNIDSKAESKDEADNRQADNGQENNSYRNGIRFFQNLLERLPLENNSITDQQQTKKAQNISKNNLHLQ